MLQNFPYYALIMLNKLLLIESDSEVKPISQTTCISKQLRIVSLNATYQFA